MSFVHTHAYLHMHISYIYPYHIIFQSCILLRRHKLCKHSRGMAQSQISCPPCHRPRRRKQCRRCGVRDRWWRVSFGRPSGWHQVGISDPSPATENLTSWKKKNTPIALCWWMRSTSFDWDLLMLLEATNVVIWYVKRELYTTIGFNCWAESRWTFHDPPQVSIIKFHLPNLCCSSYHDIRILISVRILWHACSRNMQL